MLLEVNGDVLQEVVQGVEAEYNEQLQGVIEDAVLVDLEDVL
jgi:hypothetical protein